MSVMFSCYSRPLGAFSLQRRQVPTINHTLDSIISVNIVYQSVKIRFEFVKFSETNDLFLIFQGAAKHFEIFQKPMALQNGIGKGRSRSKRP